MMPEVAVLHRAHSISVLDVRCRPGLHASSDVESETAFCVALPRRGVYVHEVEGRKVVADPTVAVFHDKNRERRTAHPTGDGDRNTVIVVDDDTAGPFLGADDRFPATVARVDTLSFLRHRRVVAALTGGHASSLCVEEWALRTIADLLELPEPAGVPPRIVDEAREYLAAHFSDDAGLIDVARQVGAAPHHLSRSFSRNVGVTMSRHRAELRARHAVDLIADGAQDLSRVAVDSGFYDHAHMTRTVKRFTGDTPAQIRSALLA